LLGGELRTNKLQTGLTYAGIASTVLVLGWQAAAYFGAVSLLGPGLTAGSVSTAATAVTGLFTLQSKFAQSRADILRKHPMSYLHSLRQ
jgi:hypothetical protein